MLLFTAARSVRQEAASSGPNPFPRGWNRDAGECQWIYRLISGAGLHLPPDGLISTTRSVSRQPEGLSSSRRCQASPPQLALRAPGQAGGCREHSVRQRRRPDPMHQQSVSVAHSWYLTEHLDRGEACAFLAEVRRILRPGGIVRVAAPDIAHPVKDYLGTGDAASFIEFTHMRLNRSTGLRARTKRVPAYPRHRQWMYDGPLCQAPA
jgi:hypothetical protein